MKISGLNISNNAAQQNKVAEVQEFLNDNYEIRIKEFDTSKSYMRSKTKHYIKPITFDAISLHLIEAGITVSDALLHKILRSPNHMTTYNPIEEYFAGLRGKYKGLSHIDLLMSHLTMREYPGKRKFYYQERMYVYMKKWFVATAACALGIWHNDVAMGLIHSREGIGKSFFFTEFIVPEQLRNLVADPKEDGKFNLEESFARCFLVYFDELFGINRRNEEEFKKVMRANQIDVYLPRESQPTRMKRIGSACFTSNKTPELGGFLTSGMGYSRWLILEIEKINKEYSKKVDVDQIWAEALLLIDQDFDYKWCETDWDEFEEHNRRYLKETTSMKYIKMYFDFPINGEGQWLQPKEILSLLISTRKLRREDQHLVSVEKLGEALNALNFEKQKIRKHDGPRSCYYVKAIN
jgi:predicted P-loop ATPase